MLTLVHSGYFEENRKILSQARPASLALSGE